MYFLVGIIEREPLENLKKLPRLPDEEALSSAGRRSVLRMFRPTSRTGLNNIGMGGIYLS